MRAVAVRPRFPMGQRVQPIRGMERVQRFDPERPAFALRDWLPDFRSTAQGRIYSMFNTGMRFWS